MPCAMAGAWSPMTARAPDRLLIAVIASVAVVGATYSLSTPLLAYALEARGLPSWLIGLNAAMAALAMILLPPVTPALVRRFGTVDTLYGALALTGLAVALFAATDNLVLWFALRLLLGVGLTGLFVVSEAWINHLAGDGRRGRVLGLYAAALAVGFTIGPALLQLTGLAGALPFLVGALTAGLAALPLILARPRQAADPFVTAGEARQGQIARLAPLAVGAGLLFGVVEAGVLSLLPLWALQNGLGTSTGIQLMMWLGAGNIALQWPIGWLADHFDRRRLILLCALAGLVGAATLPLLAGTLLLYTALFFWGGCLMGLYTVGLALLGERFNGPDLASANAVFATAYGLGALVGPPLVGLAMDLVPRHGLPLALGLACLAYGLMVAADLVRR